MEELTEEQLDKEIEELGITTCARAAYKYNRRTGGVTYESMKEELSKWEEK